MSGGSGKLATPTITLTNEIISWSQIENAEYYLIFKNDVFLICVDANSYTNASAGTYKIKAIASGYVESDFSNEVVIEPLKPTNLTNTTWKINQNITAGSFLPSMPPAPSSGGYEANSYNLALTGISNNYNFNDISIIWNRNRQVGSSSKLSLYLSGVAGLNCLYISETYSYRFTSDSIMTISNPESPFSTITITGGDNVANADVIDWLWDNATRIS